jgi:hypothetical protein
VSPFLKYSAPVIAALSGLVKFFDPQNKVVKAVTTILIILAAVGSLWLIDLNAKSEKDRADKAVVEKAAEARYAKQLLDLLTGANADIDSVQAMLDKLASQLAGGTQTTTAQLTLATTKRQLVTAKQRLTALPTPPKRIDEVLNVRDSVEVTEPDGPAGPAGRRGGGGR